MGSTHDGALPSGCGPCGLGKRTETSIREPFGFDAKGVIKPSAIVFPRDARREFDQLSGSEPPFESFKEFVPDLDRRSGHADCVMEHKPIVVGK